MTNESDPLSDVFQSMGTEVLPSVDAVTAVDDKDGRTILLGIGRAAFDRRTTQFESLWNSHHLRANNIVVDDVTKSRGGKKYLVFKNNVGKQSNIP